MQYTAETPQDIDADTGPVGKFPRVTILLATHNGARHLEAQLMSYVAQSYTAWDLWVSDDRSNDDTLAVISAFAHQHGAGRTIRVLTGPGRGPAANFMSLLTHPDLPVSGFVALSDQDDVWAHQKLAQAVQAIKACGPMTLYSAQSTHTDANLAPIGVSTPPPRALSFHNALTQNVVSGHSIVMDAQALELVRRAGPPKGIPYHDWWLYQLVTGAGGHVYVDTARLIQYRQHSQNAMGAHDGWRATLLRLWQVLDRTYGGWIAANMAALHKAAPLLTPQNQVMLTQIRATPRGPARALRMWREGLYRQSKSGSVVFYLAALLGRI